MLKISANTDNIVWVNASRNKTLSNPTYLMSLEHKVSGERKYFIPENITSISGGTSDDPRVDIFKFGVFESGESLTGSTSISLENYGWYYYRIYEQTSQTNLNPLLTTGVVDEGTLYLYPPPPDEVSYQGYSTNEIVIYDEDKTPTNHILQENEYHLLTENNELLTQE